MEPVTVEVRVGAHVLRGREVERVEVTEQMGAHTVCRLVFDRDPSSPMRAAAALRIAELADAEIVVVLVGGPAADGNGAAASSGESSGGESSSGQSSSGESADAEPAPPLFTGQVRWAYEEHRPGGASRIVVVAASRSWDWDAYTQFRTYPKHDLGALARAMDATVETLPPAPADPLTLVQWGESDWAFLARHAAEQGAWLQPTADGVAVRTGFAGAPRTLVWGRALIGLASMLTPTNHGVKGSAFQADGSAPMSDHRFHGIRQTPAWSGGAGALVAAVERAAPDVAGGGDPASIALPTRAPTLTAAQAALGRTSARRLGESVWVTGQSTDPLVRAGGQVDVQAAPGAAGAAGAAPAWALELEGVLGVAAVTHTWADGLYVNAFAATPWADYVPDGAIPFGAPLNASLPGAALPELAFGGAHGAALGGSGHGGGNGHGGHGALSFVGASGALQGALGNALGHAGSALGSHLGGPGIGGAIGGKLGGALSGLLGRGGHGAAHGAAPTNGAAGSGGHGGGAGHGGPAWADPLTAVALGLSGPPTGAEFAREPASAPGLEPAVVVANADASGQGRVRVRYAWMAPGEPGVWARVALPYAGHERGAGWVPEAGDEVVVAHVAGDPERPVVVGAVHNGRARAGHGPERKQLVTLAGHTLSFAEGHAAGADGAGGPVAPAVLELHTPGGRALLRMENAVGGPPRVTLHSDGDLELHAPHGQVRVTARDVVTHASGAHATGVGGAYTVKAQGGATVASGGAVHVEAAGAAALVAGGVLQTHAGAAHHHTGAPMELAPAGGRAPASRAQVPQPVAGPPNARPVPAAAPGRSTQQAPTPKKRDAQKSAATTTRRRHPAPTKGSYPVRDWSALGAKESCSKEVLDAIPSDRGPEVRAAAMKSVPRILAAAREAGLSQDQTAYVLGTIEHESDFGASMIETTGKDYEGWAKSLGNTQPGDGKRFLGRGLVQITGRWKYTDLTKYTGRDLLGHPELATDWDVGTTIAVFGMRDGVFTGAALDRFINEEGTDFFHARKTVNGMSKPIDVRAARIIQHNAERYQAALRGCSGNTASPRDR